MKLTTEEKHAIKKYLKFMQGFEESSLYDDYKAVDNITDEEYSKTIDILYKLVE